MLDSKNAITMCVQLKLLDDEYLGQCVPFTMRPRPVCPEAGAPSDSEESQKLLAETWITISSFAHLFGTWTASSLYFHRPLHSLYRTYTPTIHTPPPPVRDRSYGDASCVISESARSFCILQWLILTSRFLVLRDFFTKLLHFTLQLEYKFVWVQNFYRHSTVNQCYFFIYIVILIMKKEEPNGSHGANSFVNFYKKLVA